MVGRLGKLGILEYGPASGLYVVLLAAVGWLASILACRLRLKSFGKMWPYEGLWGG